MIGLLNFSCNHASAVNTAIKGVETPCASAKMPGSILAKAAYPMRSSIRSCNWLPTFWENHGKSIPDDTSHSSFESPFHSPPTLAPRLPPPNSVFPPRWFHSRPPCYWASGNGMRTMGPCAALIYA